MIRVAVLGAGNIAPSHLRAYRAFPERCAVVAVADAVPERARARTEELGLEGAAVHSSAEEVLARGDVDLVSICTPPSTHEEIAVAALEAGTAVLCEKPMAPTLAACDAILAAQQRTGALFSSVAQNRFRDDVVRTRAAMTSGLLGPVTHVQVDSLWWRGLPYYDLDWRGTWEQEGGGPTLNHAVHHLDLLLWLLGAPDSVSAVMANTAHENAEVEDLSVAVLAYERAIATVTSSVVHHGQRQRFVVQGRDAGIDLDGTVVAEVPQPNGFPVPGGDGGRTDDLARLLAACAPLAHTGHQGQVDDVLTALETGRPPLVGPLDGRRTIEVITAVYRAAVERRAVDLPLAADDPYARGALVDRAPRYFTKTGRASALAGEISVSGAL